MSQAFIIAPANCRPFFLFFFLIVQPFRYCQTWSPASRILEEKSIENNEQVQMLYRVLYNQKGFIVTNSDYF